MLLKIHLHCNYTALSNAANIAAGDTHGAWFQFESEQCTISLLIVMLETGFPKVFSVLVTSPFRGSSPVSL